MPDIEQKKHITTSSRICKRQEVLHKISYTILPRPVTAAMWSNSCGTPYSYMPPARGMYQDVCGVRFFLTVLAGQNGQVTPGVNQSRFQVANRSLFVPTSRWTPFEGFNGNSLFRTGNRQSLSSPGNRQPSLFPSGNQPLISGDNPPVFPGSQQSSPFPPRRQQPTLSSPANQQPFPFSPGNESLFFCPNQRSLIVPGQNLTADALARLPSSPTWTLDCWRRNQIRAQDRPTRGSCVLGGGRECDYVADERIALERRERHAQRSQASFIRHASS
jgi:hypothetical protein